LKKDKFKKLKQSIEENPEMLDLRELLVYPVDNKYVIIGGNMRFEVCKQLGYKELPCKIIDKETPAENLRAYVLRDNASYGEWDFNLLANEWEIGEIEIADIDFLNPNNLKDDFSLPDGEKKPFQQMAFLLSDSQAEFIKNALAIIEECSEEDADGNTNKNGNKIFNIVKQWAEQEKY
jgi:hypothetical protein